MSYTSLLYHVVFSTKDRRPQLPAGHLARLNQYIGGIVRGLDGRLLAAGGIDDHLHLALSLHPSHAVAEVVGKVKCNSTNWIQKTLPGLGGFSWQNGYAAFAVSKSALPQVERYLGGQAEHHAKRSFVDELRALLRKHGIAFEEAHLV